MTMRELEGAVAIVTGAARNIGRAIALDLAEAGAAVTVLTRSDVAGVQSVAAEIQSRGGRALALQGDITQPEDSRRMVEETLNAFGHLDILVNNAGVRPEGPFETLTLEAWDNVLAVILDGAFLCCQAALPALEKSDRAAIINIGGAVELAPKGITVNLVAPGLIETKRDGEEPVHRKTRTILAPRRGKPEDVASMVRHLAGPHGRYITGQTIHINGGVYLP
jgi:3-oxoacyl-[acyl-carrier protein] reductase